MGEEPPAGGTPQRPPQVRVAVNIRPEAGTPGRGEAQPRAAVGALIYWVQVKLAQWTQPMRARLETTVQGLCRAWRRRMDERGHGVAARDRELRRAQEPHRRLDERKCLHEEGIVDRDTLVAVRRSGPTGGPSETGAGGTHGADAAEESGSDGDVAKRQRRTRFGAEAPQPTRTEGAAKKAHPDGLRNNMTAELHQKWIDAQREKARECPQEEREKEERILEQMEANRVRWQRQQEEEAAVANPAHPRLLGRGMRDTGRRVMQEREAGRKRAASSEARSYEERQYADLDARHRRQRSDGVVHDRHLAARAGHEWTIASSGAPWCLTADRLAHRRRSRRQQRHRQRQRGRASERAEPSPAGGRLRRRSRRLGGGGGGRARGGQGGGSGRRRRRGG